MPTVHIITAIGKNGEIGLKNQLPWSLPNDLSYFFKITKGHPFISGRNSATSPESLLSPYKNVVLTSRSKITVDAPFETAASFDEALELLKNEKIVFATGGVKVYEEALKVAEKLYITHVMGEFEADTFFPKIDYNQFNLVAVERHNADNRHAVPYEFCVYKRK